MVQPHAVHIGQQTNLGGDSSNETAEGNRRGSQSFKCSNLGWDSSINDSTIHPQLENLWHANHEAQVIVQKAVIQIEKLELREVGDGCRNARRVRVVSDIQIVQFGETSESNFGNGTVVDGERAIKLN